MSQKPLLASENQNSELSLDAQEQHNEFTPAPIPVPKPNLHQSRPRLNVQQLCFGSHPDPTIEQHIEQFRASYPKHIIFYHYLIALKTPLSSYAHETGLTLDQLECLTCLENELCQLWNTRHDKIKAPVPISDTSESVAAKKLAHWLNNDRKLHHAIDHLQDRYQQLAHHSNGEHTDPLQLLSQLITHIMQCEEHAPLLEKPTHKNTSALHIGQMLAKYTSRLSFGNSPQQPTQPWF